MIVAKAEMTRGMLRLLVACCGGGLVLVAQAAPSTPVEVASDAERVAVWQALRIVVPADRQIAPHQAAELAAGGDAMSVDGPERVLGRGTSPYWAWFSLRNPEASERMRLLALESTTQFDTRLFERDATGAWRQVKSLADAAAGRVGGGTLHPVWALRLAPRQTTELLLRIEGPAIVRFPVFVYHPVSFAERQGKTHVVIGIALGTCLIIGIYIGSLRRYLDDRSVPLFICMLIADLLGALWLSGFLSELFPGVSERALSSIGFAAYATILGCGNLHARIYLNTVTWAPKADRLLQVMAWLWLGLAPWFSLAFPVATRMLLLFGGTAVPLILVVISTLAARRKIPLSGFIAAAWLTYLVTGAAFLAARVVDNPLLWSSSTLPLIQATAVAILFGFAMSQRLMRQRDALVAARQEALTRQEKEATLMHERSLLFAATNHDLRQPLFGVSLFADLLKSAPTPEQREAYSRKLDMALREVDDLLVSIQQLASVHEAAHRPVLETVKLDALLAPLIEEYRGRSEYKQLTLRYVSSRLSITTHVPYLQRIVRNALANAIRYTDRGDRILVGCRRSGGLRLVILDTGRGMSEEHTRRAFDAFQRFDAEASIPEGFGLGLFSTRSLANALGLAVSLHGYDGRRGPCTEFRMLLSPAAALPSPGE